MSAPTKQAPGDDSDDLCKSLEDIGEALRGGVEIKDRKYRFQTYRRCFVGREAVDFLVRTGRAESRADAVRIGRMLSGALGLFEHVLRDHEFKDESLFYRFTDKAARGRASIDEATGRAMGWGDFMGPSASDSYSAADDDGGGEDGGGESGSSLQPHLPRPDFAALSAKDVHVAAQVWPLDEHNVRLLDNVHPRNWVDPTAHSAAGGGSTSTSTSSSEESSSYDLVVIGAGAGGLVTSAGASGVGARVALIEENLLGGDCLNVGCVPSKALIHSANLAHRLRGDNGRLAEAGISIAGGPDAVAVDFGAVMERVRRIRSEISRHDSARRFTEELGVEVYLGRGRFASERTVTVNGRTLHFKKAVVATGGYPSLIPMPGLKELHEQSFALNDGKGADESSRPAVMTNETFFNLTTQPHKMVVIGAGVIGMELAQAMQRLGTSVTVLGRSGRVLPKEDNDLAQIVKDQMERDGVTFRLSVGSYKSVELTGKVCENGLPEIVLKVTEKVNGAELDCEIACDALLVAAGRRPNVTGMDLEKAGVKYDSKTGLIVNDKLQTSNPRVYGVGDCCSQYKFTHAADFMARAVVRNTLFFGKERVSDLLIPYATFTTPEIASVGLYPSDLKEKGTPFKTFEKHFKDNDRALCDGETTGLVRFRVDAKSDKILGATVVGAGAGNMISEITLAMKSGTGLGALAAVIHPYPTTAEAVRQAGDLYNKERLTLTVKSLLRGVIKIQR